MTSEISKRGWRQVLSSAALAVAGGTVVASLLFVSDGAISAEDKYKVQVRGGSPSSGDSRTGQRSLSVSRAT